MSQPGSFLHAVLNCPVGSFVAAEFKSPGYFLTRLSPQVLEGIVREVREIERDFSKAKPWNVQLAGQIKNEFFLPRSHLDTEAYFLDLAQKFSRHYFGHELAVGTRLLDLWVNFQRKHEYNPPHTHKGVVSFVIWVQVPFSIEDEMAAVNSRQTTNPCAANFAFVYNQANGKIATGNIPVDRQFEGLVCVFPSDINHMVYAFRTSDRFRISVSGNLGVP